MQPIIQTSTSSIRSTAQSSTSFPTSDSLGSSNANATADAFNTPDLSGLSDQDYATCLKVMESLAKGEGWKTDKKLRAFRKSVLKFSSFGANIHAKVIKKKGEKKTFHRKLRHQMDRQLQNSCSLSQARIKNMQAADNTDMLIPDGPALPLSVPHHPLFQLTASISSYTPLTPSNLHLLKESTSPPREPSSPASSIHLNSQTESNNSTPNSDLDSEEDEQTPFPENLTTQEITQRLPSAEDTYQDRRVCYICKRHYFIKHHFYHRLCANCGDFNFAKRDQTADLHGKYALVTGGRLKIGFFTALKLLQAGAHVIVTTRFPHDAILRYAKEPDYPQFKDRLQVVALDFRDLPTLEAFTQKLLSTLPRLDIIIHNACQTIHRPPNFYVHLLPAELTPIEDLVKDGSSHFTQFSNLPSLAPITRDLLTNSSSTNSPLNSSSSSVIIKSNPPASQLPSSFNLNLNSSTLLPFVPLLTEENPDLNPQIATLFPQSCLDLQGQQVDLREQNSWVLKINQVQTPELLEVFSINACAPFILNSRLIPFMKQSSPQSAKFIVNVSAMEGNFSRFKKSHHPHTNMAKAALNMMTRTSAQDLSCDNIYMTSVDTGWINDERPLNIAQAMFKESGFITPLDEIDAASRILDPVFTGYNNNDEKPVVFGVFLKDYFPFPW